jgi:enamine deaminase RidA (YjgF/YER057c/UK114 family)
MPYAGVSKAAFRLLKYSLSRLVFDTVGPVFRGSKQILVLAIIATRVAALATAAKKNKEDETQTLQLPRELPAAVTAETRRLSFVVTPLSAKGLLSQQVRDALKNLERQAGGSPVAHIRAFVAGTGDLRRVRDLISESFTARRQPLPALSLVQVGALPLTGAQVEIEAIVNGKRDLYAGGLVFFPAQPAFAPQLPDGSQPLVAPLLDRSLTTLEAALQAAYVPASGVLRATCYVSSLEGADAARARVQTQFPQAALNYVQTERNPVRALAGCEAVAALREPGPARFEVSADRSFVRIGSEQVVLTGTQESFGTEERDARLAFDRLGKILEPLGASLNDVAFARFYPLSGRIEQQIRALAPSFFKAPNAPAIGMLEFEGVGATDASFAMDAVAVK